MKSKKSHPIKGAFQHLGQRIKSIFLPVGLVFVHDVKAIWTNIAAFIIVAGLCLLPSLYAWINIYACWDPYANTGNLPIAVVNNDEGAVFAGKVVNVGDRIVEEMKTNKSINWHFVDEWQGNYGLNDGKYYALIEIPNNFSERLTSLSTATPQKPVIVYKVNEKLNAIASKITNAAKEKLANNIKTNFVKTVNDNVIQTLNKEAKQTNLDDFSIGEVKTYLSHTKNQINDLKGQLALENKNSEGFQTYLNSTTALMPKVIEQIDALERVIKASESLNRKTSQSVSDVALQLNSDLLEIQNLNTQNKQLIQQLRDVNNNQVKGDATQIVDELQNLCDSTHGLIAYNLRKVKAVDGNNGYYGLTILKDSLEFMDKLVLEEQSKLSKIEPLMRQDHSEKDVDAALVAMSGLSDALSSKITVTSKYFLVNQVSSMTQLSNQANLRLDDTSKILESTKIVVPQLTALTSLLGATSELTVNQRYDVDKMLTGIEDNVNTLSDKLEGISEEKMDNLIKLLKENPSEVTDFLASPLEVREENVYEVSTFGVGLTPFYTVLAIWVGALLMCALLSVESEEHIMGYRVGLIQRHFGKLVLFVGLSLIQATIITLGDVYLLGVHPVNLPLMIGFALLSGLTFTTIIFTLVSILGNVGKAIAVVIMVFQIAGSGGIYPIQTNPEIFGRLLPLWPFTYAISGFREAIAGPVWASVSTSALALVKFMVVFLALAVLKRPLHRLTTFFEHKFEEADI